MIVNPLTGLQDTSGAIIAGRLNGSSLQDVKVIVEPKGLESVTHDIFALNNSNGLTVNKLSYNSTSGIVTCTLVTPILGFSTAPFSVNEEIFVEGLQKETYPNDPEGTGFNSPDNGFKFFKITKVTNNNPATIEFNLSSVTTNAGVAKTNQNSFGNLISKK